MQRMQLNHIKNDFSRQTVESSPQVKYSQSSNQTISKPFDEALWGNGANAV